MNAVVEEWMNASPRAVFRAFTDPATVRDWFGPNPGELLSAEVDLRVGGSWRFVEKADSLGATGFEGVYEVVEADRRLVFSWIRFEPDGRGGLSRTTPSRVELLLVGVGGGTRVRIVHTIDHDPVLGRAFGSGWRAGLANLAKLAWPCER